MEQLNIDSFISAIDNKDINEMKNLSKNINKNDIIFELNNKNFLTSERLQFIMDNCASFLSISSNLIKQLIKDKNVTLLDIIFKRFRFYDHDFILKLLFRYKNKAAISTSDLNRLISNEKFRISDSFKKNISRYLTTELSKRNINMHIVKYLIEHGAGIDKEDSDMITALCDACLSGNETIVKYLIDFGVDINKVENVFNVENDRETPLFKAFCSGNEAIIRNLVEHGADINYKNYKYNTPIFNACYKGNEAIVRYLVENGARY